MFDIRKEGINIIVVLEVDKFIVWIKIEINCNWRYRNILKDLKRIEEWGMILGLNLYKNWDNIILNSIDLVSVLIFRIYFVLIFLIYMLVWV